MDAVSGVFDFNANLPHDAIVPLVFGIVGQAESISQFVSHFLVFSSQVRQIPYQVDSASRLVRQGLQPFSLDLIDLLQH